MTLTFVITQAPTKLQIPCHGVLTLAEIPPPLSNLTLMTSDDTLPEALQHAY